MTLNDIKDKVPSSIKLIPDEDTNSIDVLVDGFYTGYLYVTPEEVYFKTYWSRISNLDDCIRVDKFLSHFTYDLIISIRCSRQSYQIYRLIK